MGMVVGIGHYKNFVPKNDRKVYMLWRNMLERCYNTSHPAYKNYGGSGVKVSTEWLNLDIFSKDIKRLEGYTKESFYKGILTLDKDTKIVSNKIYSKKTCKFITKELNNSVKPNQQKSIYAINPQGKILLFNNQSKFARDNNLSQAKISECASTGKSSKGWHFRYV